MAFPDIDEIGSALATLISDNVPGYKSVTFESDEVTLHHGEMPLCDIELVDANPEVTAGRDYYTTTTYALEIMSSDLSQRSDAVTVRNDLWKSTVELIQAQPRFHGDIETTILGRTEFAAADDEDSGAFVAGARLEVVVTAFANRS